MAAKLIDSILLHHQTSSPSGVNEERIGSRSAARPYNVRSTDRIRSSAARSLTASRRGPSKETFELNFSVRTTGVVPER